MELIQTVRRFSWVLKIAGLWGLMNFIINPLKFNWSYPEDISECKTITATISDIKINSGYKSDPGDFRFKINKERKEYWLSTIYQSVFRDSIDNRIAKGDNVTFWYSSGKAFKNQIWQISKDSLIILPFSTIQHRFKDLRQRLLKSFALMFLGLLGWISDKSKKTKKEQYINGKRNSMGVMDFVSPKLYFNLDKNYIYVKQIGTNNTLETKTHVHIDTASNKIVAIGEENIKEQDDLIIKDGFGHERVLIGEFDIAEQVLKFIIRKILRYQLFIRPIAVVHIKRKLEGGITQVEKRSVVDSFESAGAREVILWEGDDFSERELMNWALLKESFKKRAQE